MPAPATWTEQVDETPFFFEHGGATVYAMLHAPAGPEPARRGIILCPSFADEAFRTHRELVAFARQLARAGITALRLDYRGTGDSEGRFEDHGPDDWCADIGAAIDVLQQRTGVQSIGLLGLRLGATLAATVAAADPRVQRLILWAPARSAQYVREIERAMKTQQLAAGGVATDQASVAERLGRGENVEFGGYPLTPRLYRELQQLQPWKRGDRTIAKTLLVGIRGDVTKDDELATMQRAYRDAEVRVIDESRFWFAKVFHNAENLFATTLDWLAAAEDPNPGITATPRPVSIASRRPGESPVSFVSGGDKMYGILHTPRSSPHGARGVLLFHGGRQARRGPHCMYVKVARQLCDAGFHVLRYDNRGYGDSEGTETRAFEEWLADAVTATDFFRSELDLEQLWGWSLCVGCLLAVHAATERPGSFDGFVFCNALFDRDFVSGNGTPKRLPAAPTSQPLWRRVAGPPVRKARRLRRGLSRVLAQTLAPGSRPEEFRSSIHHHLTEFPSVLAALALPKLMIFGDGTPHVLRYQEKILSHPEMAAQAHSVVTDLSVVTGGDHNFAVIDHERQVIDQSTAWLKSRAGTP